MQLRQILSLYDTDFKVYYKNNTYVAEIRYYDSPEAREKKDWSSIFMGRGNSLRIAKVNSITAFEEERKRTCTD